MEFHNPPIDIGDLPKIETLDFIPLHEKYPILSFFESLIGWLFVLIPLVVVDFFVSAFNPPLWAYAIILAISVLSAVIAYYAARSRGYRLREKDILYKEGLWWRKRTGVSFKRIQHVDLSHGPVERHFAMATIKFFTAGGSTADLRIPGLPKADAENLRTHILEQTGLEQAEPKDE